MLLFLTFLVFSVTLVYIYFNGRYNERYWKKRNVAFHKEKKSFGVFGDFVVKDRALFELMSELYTKYPNEPAVGMTSFSKPIIFVRDFENVQHVLHLDFKSFNHRGIDVTENDKLTDSILFMNGKRWKLMRQSMSSIFTGAKLKNMYYIMDRSGIDFVDYLNKNPEKLSSDIFDTLTTFCCAAILASVFGISTESIFDSPLLEMSRKAVKPTWWSNFKFSLIVVSPRLFKALNMKIFGEHEDFFIGVMKKVMRQREQETLNRHDFADHCIALQKSGTLFDPETKYEIDPTDELMAAQAFFFLIAGVEPSATALFSTLMELGRNPKVTQRVQEEIDLTYAKKNGKLSYEDICEMQYIEKVLNEGMRMYPPVGYISRRCVEDTVLPVGNIKIEKGTNVFTPIYDIHHDPKYFPEPDVFNPDRFGDDDGSIQSAVMSFGKGSRLCIGARFARLQVKTGFVHLLRHFTPHTIVHGDKIRFKKLQFQVRPENIDIKLIPRKV